MPRRMALIVGVDTYAGPFETLSYAADDARDLGELLERRGGFEVQLLSGEAATTRGIVDAFKAAQQQAPELLLFFFSGHALHTGVATWLVSHEGSQTAPGLRLADLAGISADSAAGQTLLVLDCSLSSQVGELPPGLFAQVFGGAEVRTAVLASAGAGSLANRQRTHGDLAASILGALGSHASEVTLEQLGDQVQKHYGHEDLRPPFVQLRGVEQSVLVGPESAAPQERSEGLTDADRARLESVEVGTGEVVGHRRVVEMVARLMYDALRTPGAELRIMGDGIHDDSLGPSSPSALLGRVHHAIMDSEVPLHRVQLTRTSTSRYLREFILRPSRRLRDAGRSARLQNKRFAFNNVRAGDAAVVLLNCHFDAASGRVTPCVPELPARGALIFTGVPASEGDAIDATNIGAWVTTDAETLAHLFRYVSWVAREGRDALSAFMADAMVPCDEAGTICASDVAGLEAVTAHVLRENVVAARQLTDSRQVRQLRQSSEALHSHLARSGVADAKLMGRLLDQWHHLDITWPQEIARELLALEPQRGPTRALLQQFAREGGATPWEGVRVYGAEDALHADPDRVKVTMIVGRLHGDEVEGEIALRGLMEDLDHGTVKVRDGLLLLVIGNPATDHRATDVEWADLNRLFGEQPARAVWRHPPHYEVQRAEVIKALVPLADHLLDMHASSVPTPPFVAASDRGQALRAVQDWGLRSGYQHYSYRWPKVLGGRILSDYAYLQHGVNAVAAECGMKRTDSSRRYAIAGVRAFAAMHTGAGEVPPAPTGPAVEPLVFEVTEVVGCPSTRFEFTPRVGFELVRAGETLGKSPSGGVRMIAEKSRYIVLPMNRFARLDEDPLFGFWARRDTFPQAEAVARHIAGSDIDGDALREIAHAEGLRYEPHPNAELAPQLAEMFAEEKHENPKGLRRFFNELAARDARVLVALDDLKVLLET